MQPRRSRAILPEEFTIAEKCTTRSAGKIRAVPRASCLAALLTLLGGAAGLGCTRSGLEMVPPQEIDGAWEYRWGESPRAGDGRLLWLTTDAAWTPLGNLRPPPDQRVLGKLWLRTRVPAGEWRDPALKIGAVSGLADIYVDGVRTETSDRLDLRQSLRAWRSWRIVPLDSAAEHDLRIRIHSEFWLAGIIGSVQVGDRADIIARVQQRDAFRFTVGWILVLLGALCLLAAVYRPQRPMMLYLATLSLSVAGYTLHYTQLKDIVMRIPVEWIDVWVLSVSLGSIGFLGFFEEVFGAGRLGAVRVLRWAHFGLLFIAVFLLYGVGQRSPWMSADPPDEVVLATLGTAVLIRIALAAAGIVIVARTIQEIRSGNLEARILGVVFGIFLTFVFQDTLSAFGVLRFDWNTLVPAGFLALVLGLMLVAFRRYVDAIRTVERQLAVASREKQRIARDLHDGLGGITTSIHLLAEHARGKEGGDHRDALSTISDLSRESLAEIQSVIHAATAKHTTWEAVAAEMRRVGAHLTESASLSFEFEGELGAAKQPSASVAANLERIYREALTNIVKHANATRAAVYLSVSPNALKLRVQDDGRGESSTGLTGSRTGIGNMRERATEMGGELEFTHLDQGACIELIVPLTDAQSSSAEPPQ